MQNTFEAGGRIYSAENPLLIAELGTSHGAEAGKARDLIDAAAEAGADCVKFQMVYADEILHPNTGQVKLPGGIIRLYDTFKKLETAPGFFAGAKEYAEKRGLLFLCTPFGEKSAAELASLDPALFKIASPELNYTALLARIASYKKPVLLSTGVSRLGDIEDAFETLCDAGGGAADGGSRMPLPHPVCLLHCVTAYPAPETDYNLRTLRSLRAVFGVSTGVSDHSLDPELVPCLSIAMGGLVIEKHFCLSRTDGGLDDPIALSPPEFKRMVLAVKRAAGMESGALIAELARERGAALVKAVLGDGVKRLAASERANYERTNRSLHALKDIEQGEIFHADMLGVLRTEKILRPGLPPSWAERIVGRTARQFIPAGEGIRFEDV
ncbi:MAG: N-acetylneuraminate synthase family protein [Treponema sp.]|jgi:sialic acid synthase SpsE|nr:N-acetylneuraminate synthase family protein [Treponema sp.]